MAGGSRVQPKGRHEVMVVDQRFKLNGLAASGYAFKHHTFDDHLANRSGLRRVKVPDQASAQGLVRPATN